jgi:GntR family transcriptional regulator / MocR family aminotransferase
MRTSSHLDLMLRLDRGSGSPLGAQLEAQLREAIRTSRLAPGTALPSTRALARELGISRGVAVEAYSQLSAEGYLLARQGAPTRVRAAAPAATAAAPVPEARPPRFDFRPGAPDPSLFPRERWLASLRRGVRAAPHVRFDYGDPRGAPELRAALASYLGRARGVAAPPEAVVITSGMAQGLAVTGRALVGLGARRVGIEDPWSWRGREHLAATGLEPVALPVDEGGVRCDALADARLDALVLTPAHQFPIGVVLAPERRAVVLDWAAATGGTVLEDDYDAEYRYDRQPVGAMQGLAPDNVIYAGSASKTLAPGLRLGWLVVPERLAGPLAEAKAKDDLGTPVVEQLALADFLERGELDRHLRRTRSIYRRRRDALVAALARHMPQARPAGVAAGLHLVVYLPDGTDEISALEAARARGVGLIGLSEFRVLPAPPALVLGYGRIAEPSIERGVRELAAALQ